MLLKPVTDGRPVLIISIILNLIAIIIFQVVVIFEQVNIIDQLQSYSETSVMQSYKHLTQKKIK